MVPVAFPFYLLLYIASYPYRVVFLHRSTWTLELFHNKVQKEVTI
jgi:hypothetical protein